MLSFSDTPEYMLSLFMLQYFMLLRQAYHCNQKHSKYKQEGCVAGVLLAQ